MKKVWYMLLIACVSCMLSGCGETVSAIGKDAGRMGKGINTFFFRQPG